MRIRITSIRERIITNPEDENAWKVWEDSGQMGAQPPAARADMVLIASLHNADRGGCNGPIAYVEFEMPMNELPEGSYIGREFDLILSPCHGEATETKAKVRHEIRPFR